MQIIYNIGIKLYNITVAFISPFNKQARFLANGRKETWASLKKMNFSGKIIWIHCASLGEFEQGRPLIENIKATRPEYKILLTFFSPSGFEIRKNYEKADYVLYLPPDTKQNARKFIDTIKPELVFFIKYEYWFYYFKKLKEKQIPLFSVSSIFRENQVFFKWYGGWFRKMLQCVTRFYVQDKKSAELLNKIGIKNHTIAGDTRFDRVAEIAKNSKEVPIAKQFSSGTNNVLVAGSTWPPDEDIIIKYINQSADNEKFIIAPHEIHEAHINQIKEKLKAPTYRFTKISKTVPADAKVLIIDTIGLLSAIYKYGNLAYIGGGFGKGIHNTLEAATYAMPIIFGPNYYKFKEAVDLVGMKAGFPIKNGEDFSSILKTLWDNNGENLTQSGRNAGEYVKSMLGATNLIIKQTVR